MLALKENIKTYSIENDYTKSISLEHRKKYAQFFTPLPIAVLMSKWILGNQKVKKILEPAFGLGIFTRTILFSKEDVEIKGFEIDPTIFDNACSYFCDNKNVKILLEDYMYNDWKNKYDGIICNPPYFKFHDYDNKNVLREIETYLKCKLNGFTNLYTLFLLKSIHQLNPNGRCAYIIPSEFLNSDYGKLVKTYLIKSKTLRHIFVIDFEQNVFDDALTTASIIFCANDNLTDKVQFSNIQSLQDLGKIDDAIGSYPNFSETKQIYTFAELDPEIKWKAYYQQQNGIKFKNLVPFSKYAKVVRGIATGSNEYFIFNNAKAKTYNITEECLLPCVCKATDVKKPFFTENDYEKLGSNNKNVFLLNAVNSNDLNVKKYIVKGETEGIDKKYLTARRNPWYSLENRPPAPVWVTVFNRTGLRFIRNEANTSNLTSFHCVYPKQTALFDLIDLDLFFAYLLTETAKHIFEDNSREYGNGLQKFEPNDINKGQMLDLALLDDKTKDQILELYFQYRHAIINDINSDQLLKNIDKIFVNYFI